MFKILNTKDQIIVTSKQAKQLYPNTNFLLIDTIRKDSIISGTIYAISEEPETLIDLTKLEQRLRKDGKRASVGGDYYPNCIFDYLQIVEE